MRKHPIVLLLVGLTVLATVTVAGAHGGDGSMIHACVDKNGKPTLVDPSVDCGKDDVAVDWSVTGPQGPQGERGLVGPQGPQGPAGESDSPNEMVVGSFMLPGGEVEWPIYGYEFSVENSTTIGSATGGAGAGKAKFNELTMTKKIDAFSPMLFETLAKGDHFTAARVAIYLPGTTTIATAYYLETVFVTKMEDSHLGAMGDFPVEEITMVFGKVNYSFEGEGAATEFCWDQVTNRAC